MVIVETPRLLLRQPELSDAERLMEIIWDPEVVEKKQVTLTEPPGGIELARGKVEGTIRHWELRGYGQWTVVESATGQIVGCVGFFHPISIAWPGIDLSWIIHRSRWGNGLATEAGRAAIQWAWDTGKIDHIISLIHPADLRSIRVATKIGESFERADVDPINGEPVHVYGIYHPNSLIAQPSPS